MQKSTRRALSFSVLIAAAVIFGMVVAGSVNVTPRTEAQREVPARSRGGSVLLPSFADIAEEATPSVVSITSIDIVKGARRYPNPFGGEGGTDPFDFFFRGPWNNRERERRGQTPDDDERKDQQMGTGFIISEDGYIVTNHHVVEGADKVEVRHNKEKYQAKTIGKDPATDLALLKIESKQRLTPLPLGDSERLRVGDWVMAIGDPVFFDKTVTIGVVSAKDRSGLSTDQATRSFENYIQTDAAINFGNSGGPLINVNGEVIGINTAIYRPAQNIGFAVPINTLKTILPQLREKGKVVRGYLGVSIRNVDSDIAAAFKLKGTEGAFVENVVEGPAQKAGIKPGDTIVRVDNVTVKDTRDLIGYVSGKAPGSKVRLTVVRDGREMSLSASLADRNREEGSGENPEDSQASDESRGKIGVSVEALTPQIRRSLALESSVDGLYVERVKEVSPAYDAGIREGDIITQVNGQVVTSKDEFGRIVKSTSKGEYLRIYVYKPQLKTSLFALVKIEE